MRVRLLIALAIVGFTAPWLMVAQQMQQMQQAAPLAAAAENHLESRAQKLK